MDLVPAIRVAQLDHEALRGRFRTSGYYLCSVAHQQPIFFLWRPLLRDANDDMVAEAAVASSASAIVTHNVGDFDAITRFGIRVLAPAQFLLQLHRR